MISATVDTSVLIRAINFGGLGAIILGHAKIGSFRLDISDAMLDELTGVLREKFKRDGHTIHATRQNLMSIANQVSPTETLSVIEEDPDDDRILECAAEAKSDYLVSEDKDLLRLGKFRNTKIVTIRDFIELALSAEGSTEGTSGP